MMPDDFEERLRAAMHQESARLPFVVTAADIERRLAQPSRRFPRWLALAAVPVATVVVVGILLGSGPRPPSAISKAPAECPHLVAPPTGAVGTEGVVVPHAAALQLSASQDLANPMFAPLIVRVYPETDASVLFVRGWMVRSDDPRVGGATTHASVERRDNASGEEQRLPGTYFSGSIRLPGRGCWRVEAILDNTSIGSAVVRVGSDGVATATSDPASCPITSRPDPPFVPPARFPTTPPGGPGGAFWYGTNDLWTKVNDDGSWGGALDASGGYGNKSFWWSAAFKVDEEPEPALQVTGRRLDASAQAAGNAGQATNAAASDIGSAMLTGLTLPTGGCWELTGRYRGHELSYVIWIPVADPTPAATPAATPRAVPAPPNCPITARPDPPFVPPTGFPETPRPRYAGMFWYGSEDLWTLVNESGAWNQLPNGGDTSVAARDSSGPYQDKSFWWSTAFKVSEDSTPALRVTGRRLDGPAAAAHSSGATNAIADLGPSMLTGLTVPTSGCWELTGSYRGHELSYVVWIPGPND
jgi:hypothetical protein